MIGLLGGEKDNMESKLLTIKFVCDMESRFGVRLGKPGALTVHPADVGLFVYFLLQHNLASY